MEMEMEIEIEIEIEVEVEMEILRLKWIASLVHDYRIGTRLTPRNVCIISS